MNVKDYLVVFTPSGRRGRFAAGTTVLAAARSLGVDIDSVCGGRAICGRCQVEPAHGEFAKHGIRSRPDHLSAATDAEHNYANRRGLSDARRLSCQAVIQGDLVIDVPAESQLHHQVVRKDHEVYDIEIDPVLHLYYVETPEASLDDPAGDLQRLLQALEDQWGLRDLDCGIRFLTGLRHALRTERGHVTVAVRDGNALAGIWPGFVPRAFGIAVDIGSTTLAAHLCDLTGGQVLASRGMMNPQIRFGEDLMSRVSYCMQNPGGDAKLTAAVRHAVSDLIGRVAADTEIDPDHVLELTAVGNPIMHHLFLGLDPQPLGVAPFTLATDDAVNIDAIEADLNITPDARIYLPPCIAGHVGADSAAVLLAEKPWDSDAVTLIVDVGTNAEILLGNRRRLLAASSPTGPAFEGAQISCGQRAAPGAIERVRIDPQTLEPRFKVIGCELWSDEDGFSEALTATGVTGICGSGIIEALAEMFLAGIVDHDGVIRPGTGAAHDRIVADGRTFSYILHHGDPQIRILQTDVRAIQLAKAALYAGARLLMDRFGTDTVDRIRLAGAFGSHIDVKYAMVLGMIPDCELARVSAAGNAAGTGARVALLNRASRAEIRERIRSVEKIETATEQRFQQHFVEAMAIPHASAPCPNLAQVVTLPARVQSTASVGRRKRRRRV